ncbi:hypothetical protein B0T20DRAFT_395640 [Sordaria brevicollis]|uniref:Uncharacterized protein n=1 Tax=Sordaria brevicollis TaxID=83679 RepID=A0AAE0U9U3_SORBR|nr:hypothetical protein B0T20DRAFT_395640 [Sordaria brevicollis]
MSSSPPPSSTKQQPLTMAADAKLLAEKARSTSQLIDNNLIPSNQQQSSSPSLSDPSSLASLTSLSAKLLQFNQHANTLGDCLTSASTSGVALVLATMLEKGLRRCDEAVGVIKGEVEGLVSSLPKGEGEKGPGENGSEGKAAKKEVDGRVTQEYEDLLIAYARLFIFGSQIVILNQKEQEEWMAKNDVDKIIDDADAAAEKVLAGKSILT